MVKQEKASGPWIRHKEDLTDKYPYDFLIS